MFLLLSALMARRAPGRRRVTCEGTEKVDRLKAEDGQMKIGPTIVKKSLIRLFT